MSQNNCNFAFMKRILLGFAVAATLLCSCMSNYEIIRAISFSSTDLEYIQNDSITTWENNATLQIEGTIAYIVWDDKGSLSLVSEESLEYPSNQSYEGIGILLDRYDNRTIHDVDFTMGLGVITVNMFDIHGEELQRKIYIKQ